MQQGIWTSKLFQRLFACTVTICSNIQHVSKNVTNLILTNFNKLEQISIIFAHSISRITESPVNLVYLAISHSGVNDMSPLRHVFHRAWSTKPLISGVPSCVHVLRLKLAIILNISYRPQLISVVIQLALCTDTRTFQRKTTHRIVHFLWLMFSQVV